MEQLRRYYAVAEEGRPDYFTVTAAESTKALLRPLFMAISSRLCGKKHACWLYTLLDIVTELAALRASSGQSGLCEAHYGIRRNAKYQWLSVVVTIWDLV